ncbi:ABC transporter ATP-binding protein [Homoserinibacter sp. GY 40078]|uniref:ABC transporter ATP-binding protein n=1 Tax=Homoserinibacter sp. GY 40078 TaxID=2603275 RepID=UPI0011C7E9FD|nr:ABC transporter ATP-binding protein [Homoserinibacter sp. GY 40078]TXK16366.1 ABC transporter ATP-binding protein [Homoserinibacter sp. GY 40078]
MTGPVLQATGLTARVPGRGGSPILRDVDLSVEEGESVAIVGRSGSGKSTLLTILGLLQPPAAGDVLIAGTSTRRLGDTARARKRSRAIGFVFQDYALIRELDVRGNLEMPLDYAGVRSRRDRRERVAAALDAVGMGGRERMRPGRLSGGEQQRVAIARALVTRPRIVLADEPTGALDTATGDQVIRLLAGVTRVAGSCLIMVTHDPVVAASADRVLRLDDGVLHPEGTP